MWQFVSELLRDPTRVRAGLDALMDQERKKTRGDANREAKAWLDRLAQADTMRRGFQEQAAKGIMTLDELEERLREIDETREAARAELAALESSRRRLEELESTTKKPSWNATPARCPRPSKISFPKSVTESTRCSGSGCWRIRTPILR